MPGECFCGASAPFGLSNVVATLRSHRSAFAEQDPPLGGGTPTYIVLNVPIVYNIILIVREIVGIVREIVGIVREILIL